ncbi:dead deah box dna helicase [Ophiostoma piceae UAMH 11346]|uniref:DNA 3'-5' helicase n=1 Tax=Ophiostoma piceae (strain UAMH 11346) TaxID=1262450 RepID=S3BMH6_OPHP1|nr:dead deah box dna helicase [Ophiostoma piceae UAMH 11346]
MPVQRNRFPDYFGGARSIEPVGGGRRGHHEEREEAEPDEDHALQSTSTARSSLSSFRPNQWASSGTQPRLSQSAGRGLKNLQQFAYGVTHGRTETSRSRVAPRPRPQAVRSQISNTHGQMQLGTPHRPPARPPPTPWSNRNLNHINQPGTHINWSRRPDGGYYGVGGEVHDIDKGDADSFEHEAPAQSLYLPMKTYNGKGHAAKTNDGAQLEHPQTRHGGPNYAIQHQPQGSWTPRTAQTAQNKQPLPLTPRHSSPSSLKRNPVQPVHRPATRINGIELVGPRTSLDSRFRSVFPYEHFNAMQSSCFQSVYGSSDNIVVAAPTGSGKTVIFELAVCRLLAQRDREKQDFKIVYQAPTKALCSERARDWQAKFSKGPLASALGKLQVAEFTGDSSVFEVRRVRTASIIITTPEKWDSITRKWSDHANNALLRSIKLVLIDEVHILKNSRGATLETVVSRMKTLGNDVRFVALSATIPNSADIAQWLGRTHTMPQMPARTFVFGEEFRPVQLQKIVLGFNVGGGGGQNNGGGGGGGSEHTLDNILDDQLPDLIVKHAQGKPVLIFCFSRKSTESAASALAEFWSTYPPHQRPWPAPSVNLRSSAAKLQTTIAAGVAFHHGGLERQDREMIEDAFLKGHMSIICCTSTLAVGVNLPCHTVVLKGTMGYQNGKFAEYDEFELMQMIGRAGRPQFDTSATAIILTRSENRDKYLNLESGRQTVESTLHLNLIEHLNSEIVLGTITSLATAIRWLNGTFLSVRLRENPTHYYQLGGATLESRTTEQQLEEICSVGIARLAEVGLLKYVDGDDAERTSNSKFQGTEYGGAMSTYMVRFETMVQIVSFKNKMSMEELLNAMCHATEFDDLRVKSTERPVLRELNKAEADNIPFRFKESITETWQKISLLIQVELSRGTLPYQYGRFSFEARHAMEHMQRLLESYIVCTIADGNGHNTRIALELLRGMAARAWEGGHHPAQLCQVPDIGPVNMRKLVDKNITTVRQLAGLGPVTIERFLSKNPPAAMKIADTLKSFPMLAMEGQVSRCTSDRAVAQVTVGFANEGGVPRWRNRVPALTFLAETAEGALLHIWRGKLQANRQEHDVSFAVPLGDADTVLCYIACDEIAGTLVGAQLSCVDVPPSEMKAISRFVKPMKPTSLVQTRQPMESSNPAKRQKVQHTTTSTNNSVDLSKQATTSSSHQQKTLPLLRDDTFAFDFQGFSVKQPKHCSGGGTQNDPFTLDSGSEIDDFDSDIFDDFELPAMAELPVSVEKAQKDSNKENQPPRMTKDKSPPAVKDTMAPPPQPRTAITKPAENPVRPKFVIPSIFESPCWDSSSEDAEDLGERDNFEAISGVSGTTKCKAAEIQNAPVLETEVVSSEEGVTIIQGGGDTRGTVAGDGVRGEKSEQESEYQPASTSQEPLRPNEPGWVSATTNSSIIDFLRGHVKFV